jgi:hypothetical protein
VRDPGLAVAGRTGLEQERHEPIAVHPRKSSVGEGLAQRWARACRALDPEQRPRAARRNAEALLGVGIDASETEIRVQAPRHDVGQQRRDPREAAGLQMDGPTQAAVELEGIGRFEILLERGDLL